MLFVTFIYDTLKTNDNPFGKDHPHLLLVDKT